MLRIIWISWFWLPASAIVWKSNRKKIGSNWKRKTYIATSPGTPREPLGVWYEMLTRRESTEPSAQRSKAYKAVWLLAAKQACQPQAEWSSEDLDMRLGVVGLRNIYIGLCFIAPFTTVFFIRVFADLFFFSLHCFITLSTTFFF